MGARHSKRIASEDLGDNFEAIVARATATAYKPAPTGRSDRVASVTHDGRTTPKDHGKSATKDRDKRAFRPSSAPELREYIYAYAMVADCSQLVTDFRVPSLAMVSKQVRTEALPIFYSQGVFYGFVLSNYTDLKDPEALRLHPPTHLPPEFRAKVKIGMDKRRAMYGVIRTGSTSTPSLFGPDMRKPFLLLFRNVRLRAYSGYDGPPGGEETNVEETELSITVPSAMLRPHLSLLENEDTVASKFPDEVAVVCDRIRARMAKIVAAQERFLGFSFQEVEEMALEFRCEPEPGSLDD
ncbi:hypothetical protein LTR56_016116 [Elasticomyces elasticus]|nr:hypothetical protein LTR56_016116 [Elasticomyces elasticus]KAK3636243.1 hypothetical protein LTR22_018848 [Elasticomyces elasticus]KAK4918329.1 hypothetical protein LTR49_013879 [Elasticomyces elasticus]KAK5762721.1 hypothetical protein LTS12_007110 [Elasticomyces elasticus]